MSGRNNSRTALRLALVVPVMLGLSFAAVPLYSLFCKVTGYGGTTNTAASESSEVVDRWVTVTLDANTAPGMPWSFRPKVPDVRVRLGETALVFYEAENRADETVAGTASFNVAPDAAGVHFMKIACFCFAEQVLAPHERVDMPVTFYVDPNLLGDVEARDITEITLSYTMFRTELPEGAASGTKGAAAADAPAVTLAAAPGAGARLEQ